MYETNYKVEARDVGTFLGQVVRYVSSGHYFYIRCVIPDRKDPRAVDAKLIGLYDIARNNWQRKRRYLRDRAGVHYLRCGRLFVVMLTKGRHDAFYRDHANQVCDIRRTALKAFGYSIRYTYSQTEHRQRVFVRLDRKTYRELKSHMLSICTWECFRDRERMEREFSRLELEFSSPVYQQVYSVLKAVNRARRRRGFEPIGHQCITHWVTVSKVFVDGETALAA